MKVLTDNRLNFVNWFSSLPNELKWKLATTKLDDRTTLAKMRRMMMTYYGIRPASPIKEKS